ncbi:MAG: lysophospholipid acyltransferase family protein [Myxococcota bacterium]
MADGIRSALSDLTGALVPLSTRSLQREIDQRIGEIPNRLNEYGFDPYGLSPEWLRRTSLPGLLLYRYYFRAETFDIDRLPQGRVLVIGNHAGQLPFDGLMLNMALLLEARPPRIARAMGEYWIPSLPWVSVSASRGGAMVGTPENCVHMLENEECVVAFPEGVRGMNKLFRDRYVLQRFGNGFMRLALETNTPIVPVGIVGSEEQNPGLARLDRLGNALGMPALPITWAFPWLGPAGMLPLPVKYRIYFGEPMHFEGDASDEDAAVIEKVDRVKERIQALLERGLRERDGVFR